MNPEPVASDNQTVPVTLESLAAAYGSLQGQFNNAQSIISGLQNELNGTRNDLIRTQGALESLQSRSLTSVKPKKPRILPWKGFNFKLDYSFVKLHWERD